MSMLKPPKCQGQKNPQEQRKGLSLTSKQGTKQDYGIQKQKHKN
jgi:hypothetical protein